MKLKIGDRVKYSKFAGKGEGVVTKLVSNSVIEVDGKATFVSDITEHIPRPKLYFAKYLPVEERKTL